MERVKDRFLRYVAVDTQSAEADCVPSTLKQFDLARMLRSELEAMGADRVRLDEEHAYVYARIPATDGSMKSVGFIAHMDTSPALTGENVKPRCIADYDGGDILLNEEKQIWMKTADFPFLEGLRGQEIIVTDGTTLLGADDKAGIAEIMTAAEYLIAHPEIRHGDIAVGFTPDEEVGRGVDFFDIAGFGAAEAYTLDGGLWGEIEYETFNAARATVSISGRSIHPGSAKNKMLNALGVACELDSILPAQQRPQYTEGYEGFYHLDSMSGTVEAASMDYILRDHDRAKLEEKKAFFAGSCEFLNRKYGEGTVTADIRDEYYNMKDALTEHMDLVERAAAAMKALGTEPEFPPVRGGTDGCRLSYDGLPCPNLCTGGFNYHGKYEGISVDAMEKVVELIVKIAQI